MCIYDEPATLSTEDEPGGSVHAARAVVQPDLVRRALADPLLAGVGVHYSPGWTNRGRPSNFQPGGVVCHHTATRKTKPGDYPSLDVIIEGTSDLRGPLAQFGLGRSGDVYVIAAGTSNHAGPGGHKNLRGNHRVWGIEAENDGLGEPWTQGQLYTYPRLCAALARATGFGPELVCAHREWNPARKIDPTGIDMPAFRRTVGELLEENGNGGGDNEEDGEDMTLLFWHNGGLHLAWAGRRSAQGLRPETCDALLATKDVKVIGRHNQPSELMGILPPFVAGSAAREVSPDPEEGYEFTEEEAEALMERAHV